MAHALSIRANGKAEMAYVGEVPWHGLGSVMKPGASIEDWLTAAGMDWSILRPFVRYPTSPADANNPANWRTMTDRVVLIRSDNHDVLGIVSEEYKEVQPRQVLEFFREFCDSHEMTLETAGCLFDGKRFWALARVTGDVAIRDKRDTVGSYVLLSTSADGTLATEGRFTTVRVVCNNTLSVALYGKSAFKISHRSFFDADAAKVSMGLKPDAMREGFESTMDVFRRLASRKMTKADMGKMTLEAFGFDYDTMDRKELEAAIKLPTVNMVQNLASGGAGLMGADLDGGLNTAWGWLNAVTQYVDHNPRARTADNRMSSAWFGRGDDLKTKAFEIAQRHADGTVTMQAVAQDTAPTPAPGGMGDSDFARLLSKTLA